MMIKDFEIEVIAEHGDIHYKITDTRDGSEIHCDISELNETIEELMEDKIIAVK